MAIMDAQLDTLEIAEEIQGVCISNPVSDKPEGKDVGRVGKETAGKINRSKSHVVNGDNGVKTFGELIYCVGSKAIRRAAARLVRRVTRRQIRSPRGQVRPSHLLLAVRLELCSVLRRRPRCPFHKTLPAGRALLLPGNRLLCHIGPFWWKPDRRKKGTLIKCTGALTCAWNRLKCFVRSWLGRHRTTHMRGPVDDDARSIKMCGVTPPVGASVGGLVLSGDVERIGMARGVDIE